MSALRRRDSLHLLTLAGGAQGAKRSVALVQQGKGMPVPEKLQPKKVFGHEFTGKDCVSGGTATYKKADGSLAYANIDVGAPRSPLVCSFSFDLTCAFLPGAAS